MQEVSAGSRVWVKDEDKVHSGVIQTISKWHGYFTIKGWLIIVLDGDYKVVATTMADRGTIWDLLPESAKQEPL
jgi:hypothetical protein